MKVFPPSSEERRQPQPLNIFSYVSYLLLFRKNSDSVKFNEFKIALSSKYIFLVAYAITSYYYAGETISTFYYYPTALSAFMVAFAMTVPILVGFVVLLLKYRDLFGKNGPLHRLAVYSSIFESTWLIGCAVSFALNMISLGENGLCTNIRSYGCNYSRVEGKMPQDIVLAAAVLPICLYCAVKGASWPAVVITFLIGLFASLFTVFYYNLQIWWSATILFEVGVFVTLYDQHRQNVQVFLLTESQSVLLSQIEKMAEEAHAKELRSMIANVAHDLKTVSFCY